LLLLGSMVLMRVVQLLAWLVGQEKRIGGHGLLRLLLLLLLLLGGWMLGIGRLLNTGLSVWRVVHGLLNLARRLSVDWPSMLIMLR